jgi:hypothetical protein
LAPKFKGYDDFSPAHTAAKRAACAELGLRWALVPGASVIARLPAAWVACKVFGRVSKSPRDVRTPAARFWPNGLLPIGPEYAEEGPREPQLKPAQQYDSHCQSRNADMWGCLDKWRAHETAHGAISAQTAALAVWATAEFAEAA